MNCSIAKIKTSTLFIFLYLGPQFPRHKLKPIFKASCKKLAHPSFLYSIDKARTYPSSPLSQKLLRYLQKDFYARTRSAPGRHRLQVPYYWQHDAEAICGGSNWL